jgi:hypothetical protein
MYTWFYTFSVYVQLSLFLLIYIHILHVSAQLAIFKCTTVNLYKAAATVASLVCVYMYNKGRNKKNKKRAVCRPKSESKARFTQFNGMLQCSNTNSTEYLFFCPSM